MPETNSGTMLADMPTIVMVRSIQPRTFSAATTPPRMPSGTTTTNATAASFNEFKSAGPMKSTTGLR